LFSFYSWNRPSTGHLTANRLVDGDGGNNLGLGSILCAALPLFLAVILLLSPLLFSCFSVVISAHIGAIFYFYQCFMSETSVAKLLWNSEQEGT
jgi:hypothetical protein